MKIIFETKEEISRGINADFIKPKFRFGFGSPYFLLCYLIGWMTFTASKKGFYYIEQHVMDTFLSEAGEAARNAAVALVYFGILIVVFLLAELIRSCFNILADTAAEYRFNRDKEALKAENQEKQDFIPLYDLLKKALDEKRIASASHDGSDPSVLLTDGSEIRLPGFSYSVVDDETVIDFDRESVGFCPGDARAIEASPQESSPADTGRDEFVLAAGHANHKMESVPAKNRQPESQEAEKHQCTAADPKEIPAEAPFLPDAACFADCQDKNQDEPMLHVEVSLHPVIGQEVSTPEENVSGAASENIPEAAEESLSAEK